MLPYSAANSVKTMLKVLMNPPKIYQVLKNVNGIATMVVLEFGSGDATEHRKGRFHHDSKACLIADFHLRNPVTTLIIAGYIKFRIEAAHLATGAAGYPIKIKK